jgi:hypothetical protein
MFQLLKNRNAGKRITKNKYGNLLKEYTLFFSKQKRIAEIEPGTKIIDHKEVISNKKEDKSVTNKILSLLNLIIK